MEPAFTTIRYNRVCKIQCFHELNHHFRGMRRRLHIGSNANTETLQKTDSIKRLERKSVINYDHTFLW